jgi:predicted small metal-binding protein
MFADKSLRCECGYEVQASDEAACVREVLQHAWEAHGIGLSDDVALDLVRRAGLVSRGEQRNTTREEKQ